MQLGALKNDSSWVHTQNAVNSLSVPNIKTCENIHRRIAHEI